MAQAITFRAFGAENRIQPTFSSEGFMRTNFQKLITLMLLLAVSASVSAQRRGPETASFDIIIKGGTVYDGSGRPPRRADIGIKGDRIAAVGNLSRATSPAIIDARGQAVAPGFINMLSHSESSLIIDPRSLSELKQI